MEIIKYKDFIGSVEISRQGHEFIVHGKILFINDLVTYEADKPENIEGEFHAAVDDYINTCRNLGIEPHKSFSGSFNVRIGPDIHQRLAQFAIQSDKKINSVVKNAIEEYLDRKNSDKGDIHHYYITSVYSEADADEETALQRLDKITYKNEARMN